ncbi:MAG: glycoside hydrolase family 15 protein [Thermoplasmata archaeon]|nr:glycoside hydrolase family 15 protein [Candidatus Sysuiplasma acidicola]
MPRDLPIGNGKLLVAFDGDYTIRDIYYPHVGSENHAVGHMFRVGVWVNGAFSWTNSPGWEKTLRYVQDTLVCDVTLRNDALGVELHFRDAVDFVIDALVRKIEVKRVAGNDAEVRLFFHHDFHLYGNDVGDTAFFDPQLNVVIHYKGRRYFLTDAGADDGAGISMFACGQKEMEGREGTWRDAEDGMLSGNTISQGSVDSVIGITFRVPANGSRSGYYYMLAGEDYDSVDRLQNLVRSRGVDRFIERTANYWRLWCTKEKKDFMDLPPDIEHLYRRSLLAIATNIDSQGGVIAANDTDLLRFNRDTYSYVWPRDGALVSLAMDNAGYSSTSSMFYQFCAGVISHRGYFLQKYNPDGSFASSWHPWALGGKPSLPIQEDETSLVLHALWNHFERYRDVEFFKPLYRRLIKNAADFIASYVDSSTGLSVDSYDLWEERRGVFTFTCSANYAGLLAASRFCSSFGEEDVAARYSSVAASLKKAMIANLYSREDGRFLRGLICDEGSTPKRDNAVDASLSGIFLFGVLEPDDPMVAGTMKAIRDKLWVRGGIGGVARYDGDMYQRSADSTDVQGNPWFICTLWLADWYTAVAKDRKSLAKALELLKWTAQHALPSGILAEQIHPGTGYPLSVSPLTWSHAAFVDAVDRYLEKAGRLGDGK